MNYVTLFQNPVRHQAYLPVNFNHVFKRTFGLIQGPDLYPDPFYQKNMRRFLYIVVVIIMIGWIFSLFGFNTWVVIQVVLAVCVIVIAIKVIQGKKAR